MHETLLLQLSLFLIIYNHKYKTRIYQLNRFNKIATSIWFLFCEFSVCFLRFLHVRRFLFVCLFEKIVEHVEYQRYVWHINGNQYLRNITAFGQTEYTLCQNDGELNLKIRKRKKNNGNTALYSHSGWHCEHTIWMTVILFFTLSNFRCTVGPNRAAK